MYVDRMLLTCTNWCFDWYWLMLSKCVFPSALTTRSLQMRYPSIVLSWSFICIPCLNPWDCPEVWFASSRPSLPWGIIYCRLVTWSRWGRGAGEDWEPKSGSEFLALFSGGWGYTRVCRLLGSDIVNITNGQNLLRIGKHLLQQKDLLHIHKRAKRIISWRKSLHLKPSNPYPGFSYTRYRSEPSRRLEASLKRKRLQWPFTASSWKTVLWKSWKYRKRS